MLPPKTMEDLNKIIEHNLEETIRLDFKKQLPPSGKNDDIAKDISAMANTEGGIIIYGIATDSNDRADSLVPVPITGTPERIIQIAYNQLDEPLYLESVYTITENSEKGFIIVEIPKSKRPPHFFRGTAWGRTSKTNEPLNRRRIGELFARSEGFAEEFGLIQQKPGRVHVKLDKEESLDMKHRKTKRNYYLVLKNDGDTEVFNINYEWSEFEEDHERQPPELLENPFPIKNMPSQHEIKIPLTMMNSTVNNLIFKTYWEDNFGKKHSQDWKIVW